MNETGTSFGQRIVSTDNHKENICEIAKKSSKTGQKQKTLKFAFAQYLIANIKKQFLEGTLDTKFHTQAILRFFLFSNFAIFQVWRPSATCETNQKNQTCTQTQLFAQILGSAEPWYKSGFDFSINKYFKTSYFFLIMSLIIQFIIFKRCLWLL